MPDEKKPPRKSVMKVIYLIATLALAIFNAAIAQTDNVHADEQIGTVRQVYDGALAGTTGLLRRAQLIDHVLRHADADQLSH